MNRQLVRRMAKYISIWALIFCIFICCTLDTQALSHNYAPLTFDAGGVDESGNTLSVTGGRASVTKTATFTYPSSNQDMLQVTLDYANLVLPSSGLIFKDYSKIKINGEEVSAAGRKSFTLSPGGTITIEIKAVKGSTASIDITGISCLIIKEATIGFASGQNGSYSIANPLNVKAVDSSGTVSYVDKTIDLSAYINNGTKETVMSTTPIKVTAGTPASGYTFFGWVLDTGTGIKLLSNSSTAELKVDTDGVIYPIFLKSTDAMFWVNGYLYDTWDKAFTAAGTTHTVVVEKSGTLPEGTYSMTSGQKLLVPYSSARAANFGEPTVTTSSSNRTAYRTLTLASGAIIECNGGLICVNAEQLTHAHNTGYVANQYGHIAMTNGSKINLTNGAKLYAYGYISGDGTVSATSGTEVHELIEVPGWRGGSISSGLFSKHQSGNFNSLVFVNYYIQNVLCTLEINGNAAVVVHGNTYTNDQPNAFSAPLVAPSGFTINGAEVSPQFLLSSNGKITRKYDSSADRMKYTLKSGELETGGMTMDMEDVSLDTSTFIFPMDSALTFQLEENTKFIISKSIKLLPESQLIIDEKAECEVSGSLFLYDADQWVKTAGEDPPQTYAFWHNGSDTHTDLAPSKLPSQFKTYASRTLQKDAKLQVDGTLNVTSTSGNIYCSESGANICGTGDIVFNSAVKTESFGVHECYGYEKVLFLYQGQTTTVNFYPAKAVLAGKSATASEYLSMSPGLTYHGKGTPNYWYNYTISVQDGTPGIVPASSYFASKSYNAEDSIVAYACNGANFSFGAQCCKVTTANGTNVPITDNVYSLSNITADTTLVLHEHSYTYSSVEDYSATGTCSVCGSTTTVSVPVSFEAIQLSVEAEVMLRLKITVADDFDGTIVLTEAENERAGGPQVTVYTMDELATVEIDDNGRYVLDQGIAAGEMTGIVSIEAYDADANKYYISDYKGGITTKLTRTVLQYVELAMNSTASSDDLKALMKNMVTFGGYAQEYFGVDVENPAYDILPKYEIEIPDVTGLKSTDIGVSDRTWAPVGAAAASDLLLEEETEAATEPTEAEPEVTETTAPTEPEITEPETTEATEPEGTETTEGTESTEMTETTVSAEPTESVSTDPTEAESTEPAATESVITEVTERTPNVANSGASVETKSTPPALNFMMELTAIQAEAISETVPTETIPAETIAEALTGTEAQSEEFLPMEIIVSQSSATPATPMAADAVTGSSTFGLQYDGQSVVLDSRVELKTYFTLENADISDYTFVLTYTEGKQTKTRTVTTEPEEKEGSLTGRHYVKFEVPVAYWDYEYILTAYKGDPTSATEAYALKSSVLVWSKNCIADYEDRVASSRWPADGTEAENAKAKAKLTAQYHMAQAMYYYNQAANIYFDR